MIAVSGWMSKISQRERASERERGAWSGHGQAVSSSKTGVPGRDMVPVLSEK
jgi:hypothetical protein